MTTKLEHLVDDYLRTHDAAVSAGNARDLLHKSGVCDCDPRSKAALTAVMDTHHERAVAFRALRAARAANTARRKS